MKHNYFNRFCKKIVGSILIKPINGTRHPMQPLLQILYEYPHSMVVYKLINNIFNKYVYKAPEAQYEIWNDIRHGFIMIHQESEMYSRINDILVNNIQMKYKVDWNKSKHYRILEITDDSIIVESI